jgi:hypothetical protein
MSPQDRANAYRADLYPIPSNDFRSARRTTCRTTFRVLSVLAVLAVALLGTASSSKAHPPHGVVYGPGGWHGPAVGGVSIHRSYYGGGWGGGWNRGFGGGWGGFGSGGVSISIGNGGYYGAQFPLATQYPSGVLYHPGATVQPGFGWSNLGGLNYGYGAIGGYVIAPYGGVVGPWTPSAYGYYQPVVPQAGYIPPTYGYPQGNPALVGSGVVGPSPFNNPVIQEWLPENQRPQEFPAGEVASAPDLGPLQPRVVDVVPRASNLEAKRRSIRFEAMGDDAFARRAWSDAYQRYKQAGEQAQDRVEPRYKLAYTMVAQGLYGMAALEFKRAVSISRDFPLTGPSLEVVYGPNSELLRNSILEKVAGWVREDIRDPDRLFVMGVMLHFNKEPDKAVQFLRMAVQVTEGTSPATAFLEPATPQPTTPQPNRTVVPAGAEVPAPEPGPLPVPPLRLPDGVNAVPHGVPTPILPRGKSAGAAVGPKVISPTPGRLPEPVRPAVPQPAPQSGQTPNLTPPSAEGPKLIAPPLAPTSEVAPPTLQPVPVEAVPDSATP